MNKLIWIDENTSITDKDYKRLVFYAIIGIYTLVFGGYWLLCKIIDWAFDFDWKKIFKKRCEEESEES